MGFKSQTVHDVTVDRVAGPSITHHKSKWRASNIWIRDVFCYQYAHDKYPIVMLVYGKALVLDV